MFELLGSSAGGDALCRLVEIDRQRSRLAAAEARVLVEFSGMTERVEEFLDGTVRVVDSVAEEVAAALRIAPRTARARIDAARMLVGPLAPLHAELAAGRVSAGHVAAIAREAARLPRAIDGQSDDATFVEQCGRLLDRVIPFALSHTPGETGRKTRAVVERIDPDGAERRRQRAKAHEDVTVWDDIDGQSLLQARMATPDAHALLAAVAALANDDEFSPGGNGGAACSIGQRRVAALSALVLGESGVTAHIGVVVPLDTMLNLADTPALLAGSGPISGSAAREIITTCGPDSTMYRLVVDPDGALLDLGRQRYEVSDAQREFIAARDVTCRFPGCAARAIGCQIDHAVPWDDGGASDISNLGALCIRHHQLKTHAGWDITSSAADGTCEWTSPTGRRYINDPGRAA